MIMTSSCENGVWYYADGSSWVRLDSGTQAHIEALWKVNGASWISSKSFRHAVYVDISAMVLLTNSMQYTIARVPR